MFAVDEIDIQEHHHHNRNDDRQKIFGTEKVRQPADVGLLVDDTNLTGTFRHLPDDREKGN